jgi:cell wall-associated NlpC family hydrolase
MLNGGQVYNGPLPQADDAILNQFLQTAATYIGLPYVWAGAKPSTGMDCSGYTQYVYAQHGVRLPHYSGYQAAMGIPVSYEEMRAGDLLAFGFPVHHVGIYIGDDLYIHAAGTGDTIRISRLSDRNDIAAIRRFDLQPRTGPPAYN